MSKTLFFIVAAISMAPHLNAGILNDIDARKNGDWAPLVNKIKKKQERLRDSSAPLDLSSLYQKQVIVLNTILQRTDPTHPLHFSLNSLINNYLDKKDQIDKLKKEIDLSLKGKTPVTVAEKEEINTSSVKWPDNQERRTYKMDHLAESLDRPLPPALRTHFDLNFKDKDLYMFDVTGGGDCLGYVLQLSRNQIVELLLGFKKNADIRKSFANEIAAHNENWDWLGGPEGAPIPSEDEYVNFIKFQYITQRENLDTPVAKAIGAASGFSVYIWSGDETRGRDLTLTDFHYDPRLANEKHILLSHGHYAQLLTGDASQEEVNVAQYIEGKREEAIRAIENLDYDGAFQALKAPGIAGPFVQKKRALLPDENKERRTETVPFPAQNQTNKDDWTFWRDQYLNLKDKDLETAIDALDQLHSIVDNSQRGAKEAESWLKAEGFRG